MTRVRQLWLLTALATVVVLAGGYFLLVSPQSSKAAALRDETETQLQVNRQIQSQIAMLNKQKKDLPAQQAKLARFQGMIPANPALPRLIRSLSDAADNSGVELVTIAPTLPQYSTGVNTKTNTEVPGRVTAPDGQVLVSIPVELRILGEYSQLTAFFTEIEELNRAMLVTGFHIEEAGGNMRKTAGGQAVENEKLLAATISTNVMMTTKAPATATTTTTASTNDSVK